MAQQPFLAEEACGEREQSGSADADEAGVRVRIVIPASSPVKPTG